MTDPSPNFSVSSATPLILPTITTLLGLTGLGSGTLALTSPFGAIRAFGLGPPSSSASDKSSTAPSHAEAFQRSVISAYGLRNLSGALTILGLTSMWKLSSLCRTSPIAAATAKKCLGIYMLIGTGVALGDAWVVRAFANVDGLEKKVEEEVKAASMGHAIVSVPIVATGVALFFY